ncbi:hypothetical protein BH20ACT22_BH20ACT22_19100 [soil metagenome]
MAVRFAACTKAGVAYQKFGIDVAERFGHPLNNEGIPALERTAMSAEQIVREYVKAINEQDATRFAALFAVDAVLHDPSFPEPTRGRDAIQSMLEGILRAFPDMSWKLVGDPIDAGARAAFVVSVEGTNHGPLAMPAGDVPPTGKTMAFETAVLWTIDSDGLIAEERSYFDATGVAAQLGLTG